MTDNEITAALWKAAFKKDEPGHLHARRIVQREHFKRIYARNPEDVKTNPESGKTIYDALQSEFGEDRFRQDHYNQKGGSPDFPVQMRDGRIASSLDISETLKNIPIVSIDHVFADRSCFDEARKWLKDNRSCIIKPKSEGEDG